ncbi:hypothetical protein Pla100_56590 [Neorhodopirellula pilleata]|uniref:Uncharacterized protein n=1 Tax=Neorhodopirellula pilleata TaxID=2714738 RepID=A0A5C5ZNW4_9BACT|nr:hypothetical protein Pla100_56590 [Neorhodopirellula pilleata]
MVERSEHHRTTENHIVLAPERGRSPFSPNAVTPFGVGFVVTWLPLDDFDDHWVIQFQQSRGLLYFLRKRRPGLIIKLAHDLDSLVRNRSDVFSEVKWLTESEFLDLLIDDLRFFKRVDTDFDPIWQSVWARLGVTQNVIDGILAEVGIARFVQGGVVKPSVVRPNRLYYWHEHI